MFREKSLNSPKWHIKTLSPLSFSRKVPPFSKIILAQTKWSKPYHLSMLHKTLSEVFGEKNCSIWIRQVLTKHVRKLCSRFSILCNHCPNNSSVCSSVLSFPCPLLSSDVKIIKNYFFSRILELLCHIRCFFRDEQIVVKFHLWLYLYSIFITVRWSRN